MKCIQVFFAVEFNQCKFMWICLINKYFDNFKKFESKRIIFDKYNQNFHICFYYFWFKPGTFFF